MKYCTIFSHVFLPNVSRETYFFVEKVNKGAVMYTTIVNPSSCQNSTFKPLQIKTIIISVEMFHVKQLLCFWLD